VLRKVALVILILLASPVHAGIFGPSTYEECILENMKGVQSDRAAILIHRVCRKQFPEEKKTPRQAIKNIPVQNEERPKNVGKRGLTLEDVERIRQELETRGYR
jgi:hypothetical protein